MRIGDAGRCRDHNVAVAVRDVVRRAGICDVQITDMVGGVCDRRRVGACAEELPELVARRVLAHLVYRHGVSAAMNLERHLSALEDRRLFGRQVVKLVGAGIRWSTNRAALQTRQWSEWSGWQDAEIDGGVLGCSVFVREVA